MLGEITNVKLPMLFQRVFIFFKLSIIEGMCSGHISLVTSNKPDQVLLRKAAPPPHTAPESGGGKTQEFEKVLFQSLPLDCLELKAS